MFFTRALIVLTLVLGADSHGFLSVPSSRNLIPGATYEPQSGNTVGICGAITSGSPNFNEPQWRSSGGRLLQGSTFAAEVVITAHHKGHFEFRLCTDPSQVTQQCLDQHILHRTEQVDASPFDPAHPERWYLPPNGGGTYHMEFRLPAGVTCTRCVLQWMYVTANSCTPAGYLDYFNKNDANGKTTSDWHMGWMGSDNQGTCGGKEASSVVGGAPEKFWNCADIEIYGDPNAPTASPTPEITPLPTREPTAVTPTDAPTTAAPATPSPTPTTTPGPSGCDNNCATCVSIAGNSQNANDQHCAPCAHGQTWWPCNVDGLCTCAGNQPKLPTREPTAVTPTDAPTTAAPATPSPTPTTTPGPSGCDNDCATCVSIAGNSQNANDQHCAPCAHGQTWWPCNVDGLCTCAGNPSTPTAAPTASVTAAPTGSVTAAPTGSVTAAPTSASTPSPDSRSVVDALSQMDWSGILRSQQPDLSWAPSSVYRSSDMIMAIEKMITMGLGKYRMLGGSSSKETHYALVNIAAFLAQSMHETIKYDACDENNWDSTHGYTAANACGQLGQSYQDYSCSAEEAHMQCEVDPNMEVMAMSHAKWYGAPGPMFCAPKAKVPKAPRWNIGGWCSPTDQANWKPWASPDEFYASLASDGKCNEYENQKAGHWEQCSGGCANAAAPNFGQPARTDVEGCCWWGRGVIQTTGVCNFGKLNYYAGARAAREGRSAMFPNVDFCRTPDAICTSKEHPDLKWVAGLFYWTKEVQGYPVNNQYGFDYISELEQFTDAGNIADTHFIDKCSGIVNRGCPSRTGCAAGAVHEPEKRAANFRMVLEAMGFPWTKRRAAASAPSQVKPLEPATLPFPAVRSANGPE